MSIKVSIGVAEGELDWELLEEFRGERSDARTSAPEVELDAGAGWPCPRERADDETHAELPAWAW
jgi:hypothetical protein